MFIPNCRHEYMSLVVLAKLDPQQSTYKKGKDKYVPPAVEDGDVCHCGRAFAEGYNRCSFCRDELHVIVERDLKANEVSGELRGRIAPHPSTLSALLSGFL